MKKTLLTLAILIVICGVSIAECQKKETDKTAQSKTEKKEKRPVMSWERNTRKWDFGNVERGKNVHHVFKFRNTGNAPLVIATVASSCGCTTPEYPRTPILPGGEGEVKVTFNGQGWERFTKSVTLTVNTREGREILYITGNIVEPKE